jgi:hypothetical protein
VKEVVFHPEARAETDGSVDFYDARLDGLGLRFLAAVEEVTERVSTSPDAGAPLKGAYRKRVVPRFPYSIIYRVWEDHVYVVAVTAAQGTGVSAPTAANPAMGPTGSQVSARREHRCAVGSSPRRSACLTISGMMREWAW